MLPLDSPSFLLPSSVHRPTVGLGSKGLDSPMPQRTLHPNRCCYKPPENHSDQNYSKSNSEKK
eukprot:4544503-Amphidinium_carterae.1